MVANDQLFPLYVGEGLVKTEIGKFVIITSTFLVLCLHSQISDLCMDTLFSSFFFLVKLSQNIHSYMGTVEGTLKSTGLLP
jgi:hypothetical protein